jgi:CBS domain-containing membrane protein
MKYKTKLSRWLRDLFPASIEVSLRERWRVAMAAGLSLAVIALYWRLLGWAIDWDGHRLGLLAPLGASALLVFAVPASPMAQPWPAVMGNTLSVAAGLLAAHGLPIPELAIGLALPASIMIMYASRSLHPPGVAMALLMVLSGPDSDPASMLVCGFLGSLLLVLLGCVLNPVTGKQYPVRMPVR